MKAVNYLIVELDEAYLNTVEVSSGEKVIVNSTIESVEHINREATVISAPEYTILQKGDKIIAHHNIFRLRNDTKGNTIPSDYHIKDNLYFVPLTEVFMYNRDGKWLAIDPHCFVEPIVKQKSKDGFDLSDDEGSYKGRVDLKGILRFPNQSLLDQGAKEGDVVVFKKYSEYEFNIGGKLYYKMPTKNVLLVE